MRKENQFTNSSTELEESKHSTALKDALQTELMLQTAHSATLSPLKACQMW